MTISGGVTSSATTTSLAKPLSTAFVVSFTPFLILPVSREASIISKISSGLVIGMHLAFYRRSPFIAVDSRCKYFGLGPKYLLSLLRGENVLKGFLMENEGEEYCLSSCSVGIIMFFRAVISSERRA